MIRSVIRAAAFAPALALAQPADPRDDAMLARWSLDSGAHERLGAFVAHLEAHAVADIVPLAALLRTASDWRACGAAPFEVPPASLWSNLVRTLGLLRELRARDLLPATEPVSVYRDERLNRCASGAPGSAHLAASALDFAPDRAFQAARLEALCRFWREEGAQWSMGLARYASGRIHVDTAGHRTWPANGPCASLVAARSSP